MRKLEHLGLPVKQEITHKGEMTDLLFSCHHSAGGAEG